MVWLFCFICRIFCICECVHYFIYLINLWRIKIILVLISLHSAVTVLLAILVFSHDFVMLFSQAHLSGLVYSTWKQTLIFCLFFCSLPVSWYIVRLLLTLLGFSPTLPYPCGNPETMCLTVQLSLVLMNAHLERYRRKSYQNLKHIYFSLSHYLKWCLFKQHLVHVCCPNSVSKNILHITMALFTKTFIKLNTWLAKQQTSSDHSRRNMCPLRDQSVENNMSIIIHSNPFKKRNSNNYEILWYLTL